MRRETALACAFLGAYLLLTIGCTSDLHSIEGRILFKVYEGHSFDDFEGRPRIILELRTEKIYSCCNNKIVAGINNSDACISISLKGILFPEICLPAMGPAGLADFLDLPEGTYTLNITKEWALADRYVLFVKPDSLEIVPALGTSFTSPDFTTYWRFPENSFVCLGGTTDETAWMVEDFLSRLAKAVSLREYHFPDYGEIPYPRSSEGYYYNAPANYYLYQSEADFDRAGDVLKSYAETVMAPYEGVGISLANWKGRYFYSWLFIGD